MVLCGCRAGEVVIPLQEAADFGALRTEVRRYTLGRRSTKEKVRYIPSSCFSGVFLANFLYMCSHCKMGPRPRVQSPGDVQVGRIGKRPPLSKPGSA